MRSSIIHRWKKFIGLPNAFVHLRYALSNSVVHKWMFCAKANEQSQVSKRGLCLSKIHLFYFVFGRTCLWITSWKYPIWYLVVKSQSFTPVYLMNSSIWNVQTMNISSHSALVIAFRQHWTLPKANWELAKSKLRTTNTTTILLHKGMTISINLGSIFLYYTNSRSSRCWC